MTEQAYPFDNGSSVLEAEWQQMAREWLSTGVLRDIGGQLAFTANGATLGGTLATGGAWVEGFYYASDATQTITLSAAHATLSRIDRIVLRLDRTAKTIGVVIRQGVPATTPTAPVLTQTQTLWEMPIADVLVSPAVGVITAAKVTNRRVYASSRSASLGAAGLPQVQTYTWPVDGSYIKTNETLIGLGSYAQRGANPIRCQSVCTLDISRMYKVTAHVAAMDGGPGSGVTVPGSVGIVRVRFAHGNVDVSPVNALLAYGSTLLAMDSSYSAPSCIAVGYVNVPGAAGSYQLDASGIYTFGATVDTNNTAIGVRCAGYWSIGVEDIGLRTLT